MKTASVRRGHWSLFWSSLFMLTVMGCGGGPEADDDTSAGEDTSPAGTGDDDTSPVGDDDTSPEGDDDTGVAGDDDTGVAGDDDTGVAGDDDTGVAGDDDTGVAGDDDTGVAGDDDTGVAGDDDTGVAGDDDTFDVDTPVDGTPEDTPPEGTPDQSIDQDLDGFSIAEGDCDDTRKDVNPDGIEVCDGIDNNCNGIVDEELQTTYFADEDGDGFGDGNVPREACTLPEGYAESAEDCDDDRGDVYPDALEVCDGVDNDCDEGVDEETLITFYLDSDEDTYGDDGQTEQACVPSEGYVVQGGDCDDTRADVSPGAPEVCEADGVEPVDNDCNQLVNDDPVDVGTWYEDLDGDGFGNEDVFQVSCTIPEGYAGNPDDCDDLDPTRNPRAVDEPMNGIDEDCDGEDSGWWDLDQDGYTDLVVVNYYSGDTYQVDSYIYWGGPAGISQEESTPLPTMGGWAACVADFDRDGFPDIVIANGRDSTGFEVDSYVYWGSIDGYGVDNRSGLPTIGARHCAVGDLDDDGDLDLVFANHQSGGSNFAVDSYVYYNVDGGFSTANRGSVPTLGAREVTLVDMNGDGLLELLFSNFRNGSDYTIDSYLYWGREGGYSSSARTTLATQGALRAMTVADLNGDGALDIVACNYYDGNAYSIDSYVYWGPDFGQADRTVLPTQGCYGSLARDFDQDGFLDLAFASYYNDGDAVNSDVVDNYVYWGGETGYSADNRAELPSNRVRDLDTADLDGDAYLDLVFAAYYDGDYFVDSKVYFGSSSGFVSSGLSLPTQGAFSTALADLDNNGFIDVVFDAYREDSDDYEAQGRVYWNSSRGLKNTYRSELETQGVVHLETADLNNDGFLEVIYANYFDGNSHELNSTIAWGGDPWLGGGDVTALPTLGAVQSCVADLNGDGFLDIVFANATGDSSTLVDSYIYWGSEGADYTVENRTELPTAGASSCLLSDLDADGDLDLIFTNEQEDGDYTIESYVYYNTVGVFSETHRTGLPTVGAQGVSAEDLDGNGYEDLVFSNFTDGSSTLQGLVLYWGDQTGFSSSRSQTFDAYGAFQAPIISDLNSDGYLDMVVFCYDDGDYEVDSYVYWGTPNGYFDSARVPLPGNRTRHGALADLNNDGYMDIVMGTFRDGDDQTDSYIYWGSEAGYSPDDRTTLPTVQTTYVLLDDFDQDGFTDIFFASYYDGDYAVDSYWYHNVGGSFSVENRVPLETYGSWHAVSRDMDGNGYSDIIVANYRRGSTDYLVGSPIFWNSARGISSVEYTGFSTLGSHNLSVVRPR